MSLPHILVGLLRVPMSGYDLRQEFENSLGHFWSAKLSQIYPTLKKMTSDGWVVHESAAPDRGPARIIYSRTKIGETALQDWLTNGPANKGKRLHDVAQTYFLHELHNESAAIKFLEAMLDDLLQWKTVLENIEQLWRGNEGDEFRQNLSFEDFYPYLTLDLGLRQCMNKIEWCKDSIALVKARTNV